MKEILKKIVKFVFIGLNLFLVFSLFQNKSYYLCSFIGSSFVILFFRLFYKYILKDKKKMNTKMELRVLGSFTLINLILLCTISFSEIIKWNKNTWIIILNIGIYLLTLLLIYLYARKLGNEKNAILSLFLTTFIFPFLFAPLKTNFYFVTILAPTMMFYIMERFDTVSIYRKKNFIRLIVVFIMLLVSLYYNKLCFLVFFFLFFNLFQKLPKKDFFLLFSSTILCFIISILFFHIPIFTKSLLEISINEILYLCVSYFILFFALLVKNHNVYNIEVLFLFILELIIAYSLKLDFIVLINLVPLCIILIATNIDKDLRIHFHFQKYFVPRDIKKVSVVIPNYNYEQYIEKRIDSVLKQNYPIYELILLDDASKDNSVLLIQNKIEKIQKEYPNLKVSFLPNKKNSGNVFKQWEKAFEVTTGDYIWIAEADDLCSPYFLNEVMKSFQNPNVVLSYTESLAIDEQGEMFKKDLRDWIDISHSWHWNKTYILDGKKELQNYSFLNNTIPNVSGVVFKKEKKIPFEKYLKKAQEFTLAGDWYFYSKVLMHGAIAYHEESLNYHRMHKNSVTTTTDNFIQYKEIVYIQDSIKKDVTLNNKALSLLEERRKNLRRTLCISDTEICYDKISLEKLLQEKKIKEEILLSIIIPVYNTEAYLEKCLRSVFKDLPMKTEVIIINDGSLDNSEEIILKYQKKYKEIQYRKQKNSGLSAVKNTGLKLAKGKYVIFLDSDDYVSSNMYNTMLKKAIDTDADIVYSDVLLVYPDNSVLYRSLENYEEEDNLMKVLASPLMPASWNKMVKKELYKGLTFPEKLNNEDVAVSPILFLRSNNTQHIVSPFYKYVQRSGSIQNSGFNEKRFMVFDTANICFERIKEYDENTRMKVEGAILIYQIMAMVMYLIPGLSQEERMKFIPMFCLRYKELKVNKQNPYLIKYLKEYKLFDLPYYIETNNYKKIDKLTQKRFKTL